MTESNYCCNFGRELANKETLIYEGDNFFICSAVGQMGIEGYLQLCPKDHIAGYGLLSAKFDEEFRNVLTRARQVLKSVYGQESIVFENGPSRNKKSQNPRIEHSHIHIIPHSGIDMNQVLGEIGHSYAVQNFEPLREALLKGMSYIYAEDQRGSQKIIEQSLDYSSKVMRSAIGRQVGETNTHWRDNLDLPTYYNTINRLRDKF